MFIQFNVLTLNVNNEFRNQHASSLQNIILHKECTQSENLSPLLEIELVPESNMLLLDQVDASKLLIDSRNYSFLNYVVQNNQKPVDSNILHNVTFEWFNQ